MQSINDSIVLHEKKSHSLLVYSFLTFIWCLEEIKQFPYLVDRLAFDGSPHKASEYLYTMVFAIDAIYKGISAFVVNFGKKKKVLTGVVFQSDAFTVWQSAPENSVRRLVVLAGHEKVQKKIVFLFSRVLKGRLRGLRVQQILLLHFSCWYGRR
ncbi:hypothetical protein CEXT_8041 [Caerostris extrusa]|uniref:Uncharacterized protein n=1 Tax=Caerostris extrusa TaxID=172846 RepID=A0AAV4VHQ2_CAEEX|nr:hypothetical protein CEXT_8041 [Caerostris extrusa]